jgi:hypothetical protein
MEHEKAGSREKLGNREVYKLRGIAHWTAGS